MAQYTGGRPWACREEAKYVDGLNIDIHHAVYLIPWTEKWAHAYARPKSLLGELYPDDRTCTAF